MGKGENLGEFEQFDEESSRSEEHQSNRGHWQTTCRKTTATSMRHHAIVAPLTRKTGKRD